MARLMVIFSKNERMKLDAIVVCHCCFSVVQRFYSRKKYCSFINASILKRMHSFLLLALALHGTTLTTVPDSDRLLSSSEREGKRKLQWLKQRKWILSAR
jgi:hypothetical protein